MASPLRVSKRSRDLAGHDSWPKTPAPKAARQAPMFDMEQGELFKSEQLSPVKHVSQAKAEAVTTVPDVSKENAVACEDGLEAQGAVLVKLFAGLESVLLTFKDRQRRPVLAAVRKDVEGFVSRMCTEERVAQILALSNGMLEVVPRVSVLEVRQLVDGEIRTPTSSEQAGRLSTFNAAVAAALKTGLIPSQALPSDPRTSEPTMDRETLVNSLANASRPSAPVAEISAPSVSHVAGGSVSSKMSAMRERVLARQEAARARATWESELEMLRRKVGDCEDALSVHAVVQQLFARGDALDANKGGCDRTSDLDVLKAVSSSSSSSQVRRPMDLDKARTALAMLVAKSTEWFCAETPQYSQRIGSFYRRLPNGNAATALEAIKAEILALKNEREELYSRGPRLSEPATKSVDAEVPKERQQNLSSESPSAVPVVAAAATLPFCRLRLWKKTSSADSSWFEG